MVVLATLTLTGGAHASTEQQRMTRLIRAEFGHGHLGNTMVCIARRESGLNPRAINWSDRHSNGRGSFGLFQLGRVHVGLVGGDWRRFLDPKTNVRAAKRLYERQRAAGKSGLGPWGGKC